MKSLSSIRVLAVTVALVLSLLGLGPYMAGAASTERSYEGVDPYNGTPVKLTLTDQKCTNPKIKELVKTEYFKHFQRAFMVVGKESTVSAQGTDKPPRPFKMELCWAVASALSNDAKGQVFVINEEGDYTVMPMQLFAPQFTSKDYT